MTASATEPVPTDPVRNATPTERVLAARSLTMAYQPIVELTADGHGAVVGYEALARWPDTPHIEPADVFDQAPNDALLGELDWQCRLAAVEGALNAGLAGGPALFVNLEPASLRVPAPDHAASLLARAGAELDLVVEITERNILHYPAELLATVDYARRQGWRIALDDVGANPDSLALLEFVHPDVVKLDLALVQQAPARHRTRTLMAVLAYCERSGAAMLAEGIEDLTHYQQAWALGATLGQGWLFGRPCTLLRTAGDAQLSTGTIDEVPTPATPYELASRRGTPRVARKELLTMMSRDIELQASASLDSPVVLAAFQDIDNISATTRARYKRMSEHCSLVVALGVGLRDGDMPGVRTVDLSPDDPLTREWTIVVVGPHYASALIARDLASAGHDADRLYRFVVTHDRQTAVAAGRSLLLQLAAGAQQPS